MKNKIKKCIISKYDKNIKEPPFLTISIDIIEVIEPDNDDCGEKFAEMLNDICFNKGYIFKFYTTSKEKDIDYEIVVY
jgi:hypothetical protein